MTATAFVLTSYVELQDKIKQQAASGEEVYQLKGGARGGGGGGGAGAPRPARPAKQAGGKAARRRK